MKNPTGINNSLSIKPPSSDINNALNFIFHASNKFPYTHTNFFCRIPMFWVYKSPPIQLRLRKYVKLSIYCAFCFSIWIELCPHVKREANFWEINREHVVKPWIKKPHCSKYFYVCNQYYHEFNWWLLAPRMFSRLMCMYMYNISQSTPFVFPLLAK